jgi:uncharacterized NAD-dependent epimerase/dehydratase family protein
MAALAAALGQPLTRELEILHLQPHRKVTTAALVQLIILLMALVVVVAALALLDQMGLVHLVAQAGLDQHPQLRVHLLLMPGAAAAVVILGDHAQVVAEAPEAVVPELRQYQQTAFLEQPTQAVVVVVLHMQQRKEMAALAALASSSSRSTNKDLWKPKSTDFSA